MVRQIQKDHMGLYLSDPFTHGRQSQISDVTELIERLARLEHEQWMDWATTAIGKVSIEQALKWDKNMIPYDDLPEDMKEKDRIWARKVIEEVLQ